MLRLKTHVLAHLFSRRFAAHVWQGGVRAGGSPSWTGEPWGWRFFEKCFLTFAVRRRF